MGNGILLFLQSSPRSQYREHTGLTAPLPCTGTPVCAKSGVAAPGGRCGESSRSELVYRAQ